MSQGDAKNLPMMLRQTLQSTRTTRPIESDIRQLLDRVEVAKGRRLKVRLATLSGSLAVAAVLFGLVVWPKLDHLKFTVGTQADPGVENRWIQAETEIAVPLRFSDDSSIELLPGTRARVASVTRQGANLNLETGRIHAKVMPRKSADWLISAGPYAVHVVGTEFDVAWDPEALALEVEVTHGAVKVNGPVLSGDQMVTTSQRLTVAASQGRATIATIDLHAGVAELEPAPLEPAEAIETEELSPEAGTPGTPAAPSVANWQSLARRGEFAKAYDIVERLGFDNVARTVGSEDLLRLSDVARIGGQPARATQILHTLRRRFPHSRAASMAAYTMGVTAFDQSGAYTHAVKWFNTYLREQPSGPLAAEALGRLMEAEERMGRHDRAVATARRYIAAYPNGPHRDVAERLSAH